MQIMYCQVFDRSIKVMYCSRIQPQLPTEVCDNCSWKNNLKVLNFRRQVLKQREEQSKKKSYTVYIPDYLKKFLKLSAKKEKLTIPILIKKILIDYKKWRES